MKVSYDNKVYLDELKDIPNKNKVTAEDMNEIKNAINSNSEEISKSTDEYSSSKTYSTGDLVIYNNKLYKASQDITTAEAFNSSHWTEVTLLSDVNEIKDVIDAKANSSDVYTKTEIDTKLNYSTEEQVIGKWNNKPLYRKYFFIPALPNNTYSDYDVSINNLNYVTKLSGMAYTNADFIPIPDVSADSFIRLVAFGKTTSSIVLRIQTASDRSNMRGIIIMEYTKTTD